MKRFLATVEARRLAEHEARIVSADFDAQLEELKQHLKRAAEESAARWKRIEAMQAERSTNERKTK